jgi:hypothetical protein
MDTIVRKRMVTTMNREEWLQTLTERMRGWYGGELPETVHVSVGFPSSGMCGKAMGECWHAQASADSAPQVYVHPKIADATEVAAIMAHELVHACRPDAKHGPAFKALATRVGLTGRMTSTVASDALRDRLAAIVDEIGPYPHPCLSAHSSGRKKQSTRLLKVQCPGCDYTVRITQKWIDTGLPVCPCGTEMETVS